MSPVLIDTKAQQKPDGYLTQTPWFQFILLSLLFPMWGAAAGLNDILITQFKTVFALSDAATAFVQSAFYGGYFLIAIPASRLIRRTSYKTGVIIGLVLYGLGCGLFFPAAHVATYALFLFAIFSIAVGLSFLETSANTFSSMLGPRSSATLRLNISQTFTPVGNLIGVIMGKYLVFGHGKSLDEELKGLEGAERQRAAEGFLNQTVLPYQYILLVLVVLLILFVVTKYPTCKAEDEAGAKPAGVLDTISHLGKNVQFLKGIGAQFVYVGLQTAVWSFTIRLALETKPDMSEYDATNYMIFGFLCFFLGKFPANFLMSRLHPARVMIGYAAIGSLLLVLVALGPAHWAVWGAVATSLLMGPCWPTIFGRALETIDDKRYQETGGAIIVMAIVGGAVVPVIQGWVSDLVGSLQTSFLVSAACFAIIMVYFMDQTHHMTPAEVSE